MTTYKRNCLIIFAACCLAMLVIVSVVRADDWSCMAQGGIKVNSARSKGYSPGIGIQAEAGLRWKFLEGRVYADYMSEHKAVAEWGRHYQVAPEIRGYVYGPFFLSGNAKWAGYWSDFTDGTRWEKHGMNWGFGAGYNDKNTEVQIVYYLTEYDSPNRVQATVLQCQQRIWKGLFLTAGGSYETWDQSGERWSGPTFNLGIVWRFE